jgi:hypothetical protein
MEVHVVIGVYSGVVEDAMAVHVYRKHEDAERRYEELRREFGIKDGEEAYSDHDVRIVTCVVE